MIAVAQPANRSRLTASQRAWEKAARKRAPVSRAEIARLAYLTGCRPASIARAIAMGVLHG